MADERRGWKQFRELKIDSKKLSKRMKKAEGVTTRHARKFIVKRLDNIRSVRRHIIVWLLLVGAMIIAVGVQYVWFRDSYQTMAAAQGGTYAEASLGPIDTLNPLFAASSAETAASRLMFSSLFTYDQTGHVHGDLAESMRVDKTGKVYTVTLRPGVLWHDGANLTAEDVAFTINLIKNPQTRSPLRVNWEDITVKALDTTTVQFQLPAVYAAFPNALTFPVLPKHVLGGIAPGAVRENVFSRAPVGSGPFGFSLLQTANATRHRKIVYMTANERYYGGKPMLARMEVHAYDTQSDIIQALKSGEVNAAADLAGTDPSQIDTHSYNVVNQPTNSGVYAIFNTEAPVTKDQTVRRALQLATDTNVLRAHLPMGVPPLTLPFINGQVAGKDLPQVPASNAKRAAALLDKAGWKLRGGVRQKGKQKLELTIATTRSNQYEKALESLAGQWRRVGVVVHTNVVDTSDPATNFVQDVLQRRNYDVLLYELFIGADPDVYAYWHSSQASMGGYNFANYVNGNADAALASARARLEPALRNVKYKAFARQWVQDVPAIGLYQSAAEYVVNKRSHTIDPHATLVSSYDRYANVLDWSVSQKPVYKTP